MSRSALGANIHDSLSGKMSEDLCPKEDEFFKSFFAERTFNCPFKNFDCVKNNDELSKIKIINLGNLLTSGVFLKIEGNLAPLLTDMLKSIIIVCFENESLKPFCMHFFYHFLKLMFDENEIFNRPDMQEM